MATRTREGKLSIFTDKIDILNRNAVETSPAKEVYRTVIAILALVRVSPLVVRQSVNFH